MGTKAVVLIFYGTESTKIEKILWGNKGTQDKFSWEEGDTNPPAGRPSREYLA